MAEHELCKLGVTGSSPVASTRKPGGILVMNFRVAGLRRRLGKRQLQERKLDEAKSKKGQVGRVAQLVRARP